MRSGPGPPIAASFKVMLPSLGAGRPQQTVPSPSYLLETLTSAFNPLPAIALLPLALIWFGLGDASIVFVLVHSVLWAVALNTHSGFKSVSNTLRMVGRNCGLKGPRFVVHILIPAAFASILTGLKIGWAFA